jgi:hypothetical protein
VHSGTRINPPHILGIISIEQLINKGNYIISTILSEPCLEFDAFSPYVSLSVPCRPGTPTNRLKSKIRSKTYYHMSYSSESLLPARQGSGVATCPVTLNPASLLRRAPVLPRALWLRTTPPCLGELQRSHVSRGSQQATSLRNNERSSWPRHAARLTCFHGTPVCFQSTLARYQGTCKTCGQATSL